MPKRGAEDYITKEHGAIPNNAGGDEKVKMSTAAQQARRKIATPRGRLGANRPHSSMAGTNTFGQTTQQQQPFPTMNGGTSFGTSMSFPQTGSTTNSGFNFQPPQSSSFTFGAPTGTPNPFATLNGTGGPGDSQQGDIAMESPQKKAATGNTFGSSSGFSFGQTTQQPSGSGFSFGGSQSTQPAANGTNPFNAVSKPDDSAIPANPFGQPSQPAFAGFGQSAQTQSSGFTFGQSTSTPAPAAPATTTSSFNFGQNTSAPAPATTAPSFSFGQTSATPQSALPAFSFGQASTTQAEAPKEAPKFSFGQSPATTETQPSGPSFGFASPAVTPASQPASTFSFGQPQQSTAPSTSFTGFGGKSGETKPASSLFGSPTPTPQPAATEQRSQSPEKPATPEPEKTAANPFASLFAGSSSASPAPVSKPAFSFGTPSTSTTTHATEPSSTPSKPAFSFGAANQASTPAAATTEQKPSHIGSTFSFGANSAQVESTPNARGPQETVGGVVGEEKSKGQEDKTTSTKPMFGFAQSTSPAPTKELFPPAKLDDELEGMSQFSALTKNSTKGVTFGAMTEPLSYAGTYTPSKESGFIQKPLFGAPAQKTPQTEKPSPAPTFSAPNTDKAAEDTSGRSIFSKDSTTIQAQGSVGKAPDAVSAAEFSKRPVYTKGSSYFPGHLDARKFQEYDRDYRLHSLNRELQKRIAVLDPTVHDFGNIIRHYVAARDGIGASLGLYKRSFAGSKRKGDDVDDHDDEPPSNKRTRPGDNEQAQPPQPAFVPKPSTGPFTPQPSSFKAASTTLFPPSGAESSSKAVSLLNNMIPQSAPAKSAQSAAAFNPSTSSAAVKEASSNVAANPFASLKTKSTGSSAGPISSSSTTPTKSPPKKPTFELPKFGGGSTNFMGAFGQQAKANAEKFEKSLMEKRKAEDFDSDEDDEEQFQKQLDEEAKAKRAKIDAIAKGGFTPSFTSSTQPKANETPKSTFGGFKPSASNPFAALNPTGTSDDHSKAEGEDEDASASPASGDDEGDEQTPEDEGSEAQNENEEDDEEAEEDDDDDDNDFQTAMAKSRNSANAGKSLFDRIEPNPNKQDSTLNTEENTKASTDEAPAAQAANKSTFSSSSFGFQSGKSTPETPSFSPNTPATGTYKPSTTFTFTPTPPTSSSTPTPGASIFAGGLTKDGPVPGEGLFGSRPSTPSNGEKSSSLARSVLTSPAGTDNTWKQGGAISFANGENKADAPSFKFTAPSPGKETPKPFGSLFGTPAPGAKPSDTPTLGFQFGAPTSTPAPGFLGAVTHLGGGSATSSAMSSRATSPGLTDNESNATNDTEETNDEPQVTLMDSRAGEENETCLWEGRSKALMFVSKDIAQGTKLTPNDWNSMGVGVLRVLKDKTTGKTRVVFRVEPSASVLINSHLLDSVTYENVPSNKSGAVRGALFYKGNLARWVFKVKTPDMASDLSTVMEENKKSG